jgi:hypothetical protein
MTSFRHIEANRRNERLTEQQRVMVRSAYARARKNQLH